VNQWLSRIARVMRLDPTVFEEVEHDHSAGPQAFAVVLTSSLAGGAGNLAAAWLLEGSPASPAVLLIEAAGFVVAWIAWSFVTLAVGTTCFRGCADMGEMQRALGFAAAPGILMLLPGLGTIVGIPWALVAMVIAVRQALDMDTRRALGTVAVSAVVMALVLLPAGCFLGQHFG
jgi:hypothetical protein